MKILAQEAPSIQEDTRGINLKIFYKIKPDCPLQDCSAGDTMGWHRRMHPRKTMQGKEIRMRAFKVFIFGLLYGWVFKIAFDRIYRENDVEDLRSENASLREYIRTLESKLQARSLGTESVRGTAARLQAPAEAPAPQKDDLKAIKGIGPAIEKKLNSAGVHTYADLSALTTRELENILGSAIKRLQDEKELIAQAKKLAKR